MSVTWDDCINLDPQLAAIPDVQADAILADAKAMLSAERFGTKYDLAVKYLAMHTGCIALRGGGLASNGPVAMERLGDAQVSYAISVVEAQDYLDSTPWGKMYKKLIRSFIWAFVA